MCADNDDVPSGGDREVAGEASGAEGGASGNSSTTGGVGASSQGVAGVPFSGGVSSGGQGGAGGDLGIDQGGAGAWAQGGQGGAGGAAPRCADTLAVSCLATADVGAGGAATWNAVAEVVGVVSLDGLNNHNQIVGSQRCGGGDHAFMRDENGVHDLLADEDDLTSAAYGINDRGVVVGEVAFEWLPSGTPEAVYPFIWRDGVTTVLRDLPGARAIAVNGNDQVLIAGAGIGSYLWEDGVLTQIGKNLSLSVFGLNDLGQVVGKLYKGVGNRVGFIWEDGVLTEMPMLQSASAINDSGQIAGVSAEGKPVLLDGASLVDLGALRAPIGIAPDGTVLGPDYIYAGGVLTALNGRVGNNSFEEVTASAINADHVIVGRGSVLTFVQVPGGGCRLETCEAWTEHEVVWKDECFGACCGEATGAGGAAGAGGTAGAGGGVNQ